MNLTALAIQHTVKAALLRQIQGVDQAVAAKILRELADEVESCEPPPPPPELPRVSPQAETKSKAQRMREALAGGPKAIDALARELAGVTDYIDGRSVQGRRHKVEIGQWKQIALNLVAQGDLERRGQTVRLRAAPAPRTAPPAPKVVKKAAKPEEAPPADEVDDKEGPAKQAFDQATVELARAILREFDFVQGKSLSARQVIEKVSVPSIMMKAPGTEGFIVSQLLRDLVKSGALTEDPLDSSRYRRPG